MPDITVKICKECKTKKELEFFSRHHTTRDGYRLECKDCRNKKSKLDYFSVRKKMFISNPQKYLWTIAKSRAKKYNIKFTIKPKDIVINNNCPISGKQLVKGDGYHPDAMSLDRVIPSNGYVPKNVVVISRSMNLKKSNLTTDMLNNIIKYINTYGYNNVQK